MKFSSNCTEILKNFEGFRTNPYLDSVKVPTIGYGSTVYEDGTPVKITDGPVTKERALKMLLHHLNKEVLKYLEPLIKVDINQNQIDALGSLIYNIGIGNFKKSSVLKDINNKEPLSTIETSWKMWNKAGGKELWGLTLRRAKEWELYKKPVINGSNTAGSTANTNI
jgi:lysozyme